jgi:hypothetical protein
VYVVVDDGLGIYVVPDATVLPPQEACEYHAIVRAAVPPAPADVSVTDWPLSSVGADGVIAPADSAGVLTVTVSPAEQANADVASVTL